MLRSILSVTLLASLALIACGGSDDDDGASSSGGNNTSSSSSGSSSGGSSSGENTSSSSGGSSSGGTCDKDLSPWNDSHNTECLAAICCDEAAACGANAACVAYDACVFECFGVDDTSDCIATCKEDVDQATLDLYAPFAQCTLQASSSCR